MGHTLNDVGLYQSFDKAHKIISSPCDSKVSGSIVDMDKNIMAGISRIRGICNAEIKQKEKQNLQIANVK